MLKVNKVVIPGMQVHQQRPQQRCTLVRVRKIQNSTIAILDQVDSGLPLRLLTQQQTTLECNFITQMTTMKTSHSKAISNLHPHNPLSQVT